MEIPDPGPFGYGFYNINSNKPIPAAFYFLAVRNGWTTQNFYDFDDVHVIDDSNWEVPKDCTNAPKCVL